MIKKNRIPRDFAEIVIKIKVNTNVGLPGDTMIVTKDRYGRYIGINERTGIRCEWCPSVLRDANKIEILNIIK